MPATLVSLGMIVHTNNEESFKVFQRLATEAGLKDASGSPLQVRSLLPRLLPLFPRYNQGELSTDQFITEWQKVLPLSIAQIKEAWNAMCIVDEQALETLAAINALKKSKSEKIYIYSDTNPMHFEKISSEIAGKKPSMSQPDIATSFKQKLSKPLLLRYVVDLIKGDGHEACVLVKGNNGIDDKLLSEQFKVREQQVLESVSETEKDKQLKIIVHEIDDTRLSASVLKELQTFHTTAPKKDSSLTLEAPTEDSPGTSSENPPITLAYATSKQNTRQLLAKKPKQAGEKNPPELQQQEGSQRQEKPSNITKVVSPFS